MHEVVFMAPLPTMRKRTRLSKMIPQVLLSGCKIRFFGWERVAGEFQAFRNESPRVQEQVILRGGGYASTRARFLYPLWMFVVFFHVLRLGKNKLIFALGWETAFPAQVAAIFTGSRIVFDDADRFSMIVRLPRLAHRLLQWLEIWTSRRVSLHIVPGFSRYEWRHDRMVVLRNSPLAADFFEAFKAVPLRPKNSLVLYANGWIGETRGASVLLDALNIATERGLDLKLLIAGRVDGEAAPKLINHPKVMFYGELPQRDALALYPICDAVVTLYDPTIKINRKAEANKWGDAVFFGCPIIVNSEVETARPFADAGAAFAVPYRDVGAFVELLEYLIIAPDALVEAKRALSKFKPDYPVFDEQIDKILDRVLPEKCAAPKETT